MKKILIIDDQQKIRRIYKAVLDEEGFDVVEANSVRNGIIEIFRKKDIDLVVLDICMFGARGDNLMRIADDYDLQFKIIVSSVYSLDRQRSVMPGANDYFDKMDGVDVLIQKIKMIL